MLTFLAVQESVLLCLTSFHLQSHLWPLAITISIAVNKITILHAACSPEVLLLSAVPCCCIHFGISRHTLALFFMIWSVCLTIEKFISLGLFQTGPIFLERINCLCVQGNTKNKAFLVQWNRLHREFQKNYFDSPLPLVLYFIDVPSCLHWCMPDEHLSCVRLWQVNAWKTAVGWCVCCVYLWVMHLPSLSCHDLLLLWVFSYGEVVPVVS